MHFLDGQALPLPNAILGRSKTVRSTGTSKSSPPRWATGVFFSLSLLFLLFLRPSPRVCASCYPYSVDCIRRISLHPPSAVCPALLPLNRPSFSPKPSSFTSSSANSLTLPPRFKSSCGACASPRSPYTASSVRSRARVREDGDSSEGVGKPWYSVRSRLSILFLVMFLPAFPYIDPHRTPSISFPMHVLFTLARRPHLAPLCLHTSHTIAVVPFYSLCIPPVHALPSIRVVPLRLPIGRSTHPRPRVLAQSSRSPVIPILIILRVRLVPRPTYAPQMKAVLPSPSFVRIPSASSSPPLVLSWLLRPRPPKPMPAPPRTLSPPACSLLRTHPRPAFCAITPPARASHRRLFPRPTSRIPPHAAFLSIPFSISPSRHSVAAD
ncbi:hypothetical protein B0H17DRAFT_1217420 [Mycena rosella]|uniref:Uncharacterized protein n=1 Tax=Mycena rosella TaxID=1033263 RepID=A0AAD7BY26_MYCRO|nr:hypothetical protein B0H17DRAFT_1217420 [Mycena rosella]